MFIVIAGSKKESACRERAQGNEGDTVEGMGDGCSYKIANYWYRRLGHSNLDKICKILSRGGATHVSVLDDTRVVNVEFYSYIAYVDSEIGSSNMATILLATIFAEKTKERERSSRAWNGLVRCLRSDLAVAAMRLCILNRLSFTGLEGESDAAVVRMEFDSRWLRWAANNPGEAVTTVEETVAKVTAMRRPQQLAKGNR